MISSFSNKEENLPCLLIPLQDLKQEIENLSQIKKQEASLETQKTKKALFFDRDGTLMKEVDHCHRKEDVELIDPSLKDLLKKTKQAGWLNIIITNQSGIARGYFTHQEFEEVEEELESQLGGTIDAVYMAPDLPESLSMRRKPAPGMLFQAAEEFNIDLSSSYMIGDRATDILAGKNAGCKTILVRTGYGKEEEQKAPADRIATDIIEALEYLLSKDL